MVKLKPSPNAKQHPRITSAKIVFYQNEYSGELLSFAEFLEMSQQQCYYCNAKPVKIINKFKLPSYIKSSGSNKYSIVNGDFKYNGLDRIDSSKPHSKDNCVPCCFDCNKAKSAMSIKDFKKWINKVYKHFIKNSK